MNNKHYNPDLDLSKKYLANAQSLFQNNINLLNEPRLLVRTLENLFFCFDTGLDVLLNFSIKKGIISDSNYNNFNSKLSVYSKTLQKKHKFDIFFTDILKEVHELYIFHKKSPIEFVRQQNFVICSNDYDYKMLTFSQIDFYISKAKIFIAEIDSIICC